MQFKKLSKDNFYLFVERLKTMGRFYGPVRTGAPAYAFKEISSPVEIEFSYVRTMIPPKKFFIKPQETILEFNEKKWGVKEIFEDDEKIILFGIHPCDINGLKLIDKIYLDDMPDKYYRKRRESTVLIGFNCHPDENCFCNSMGTSYAFDGFDLFLHEINDGYFIRVGSNIGQEIISENIDLVVDVDTRDIEEFEENETKRLTEFKLELNIFGLQDMLELAHDSQVWKQYANRCFGCGNCNLTCPTCRCYETVDHMSSDLNMSERKRRWDSCMLRKHGLVAGGLNFRPTLVERLRNRFNCKGSLREGMLNCVGCGRCTVYCPADIRYVEVLKRVRGEMPL